MLAASRVTHEIMLDSSIVLAIAIAEKKPSLLSIDGSFLVVLFLFLILVAILNRTVFKPVLAVLAERERLTVGAIQEAAGKIEKLRGEAERYELAMREARAEAYRELERLRNAALAERSRRVEAVKAKINMDVSAQKAVIESQTAEAKTRLKAEVRDLALQISSTLLQRPIKGING